MTHQQQRTVTVRTPSSGGKLAGRRVEGSTPDDLLYEIIGRVELAHFGPSDDETVSKILAEMPTSRAWRLAPSEIATLHHIGDAGGHQKLAVYLTEIRDWFESALVMRSARSSWSVPKGKTPWKTSRRKLLAVLRKLESLERSLLDAVCDPVAMGAIVHVQTPPPPTPECPKVGWSYELPTALEWLETLEVIIDAASRLPQKDGNRRLPDWTIEAADACRKYWRTLDLGEPSASFSRQEGVGTIPESRFSKWFCAVMNALAGLTASECKTILGKKPLVDSIFWRLTRYQWLENRKFQRPTRRAARPVNKLY